ncbi:universal stress protein [Pedobacter ginsengisoli]|uniref:universal stress protein n=1 Tax=Pedobacter ginsengisoli TaxID=363852 RepID=UPI00255197E4|nr:universal stress protein [Pedobacter ginsengisoli]
MKPILVPTDFSDSAENAAWYALHIARYMKTNIELCHAFLVPAEYSMAGQAAFPAYDYSTLKAETSAQLVDLARKLDEKNHTAASKYSFHPGIKCVSEAGVVPEIVGKLVEENPKQLVVLGMSDIGATAKFILGSSSRNLIEKGGFPLLLIPSGFAFNEVRKIAFATDLRAEDIKVLHSLAGFARYFDAEIVVTHVSDEKRQSNKHLKREDEFLSNITSKVDYDKIFFRRINNSRVSEGLDWLSSHGHIDILVMIHRPLGFLDRLFKGSYTKNQADHINIPLLVFPEGLHPLF